MIMSDKSNSWIQWLVVGIFASMIVCLCSILSIGGTAMLLLRSTATPALPVFNPTEAPPIEAKDLEMRETLANTVVPLADPIDLAERLLGLENIPRVVATHADPIPLGTTQQFWASNNDTIENFRVTAQLVYATDHVYFWIERGVTYDINYVRALVDDFENNAYPTVREFFGSEWLPGVDGDEHLYILVADGLGENLAGYFGSSDEYPPSVHDYSNAHEMFYLASDLPLNTDFTYGVLAHEFQHMVHWYLDTNESTWLNEGFSELASLLTGHDPGGADYSFASDPDIPLTFWPPGPGSTLPHYGQSFLFVAYYMGRLGSEATQALAANPMNSLDSIDSTLLDLAATDPLSGEQLTADQLYRDFAAAILLRDDSIGDGRYVVSTYPRNAIPLMADYYTNCPIALQSREVNQYGIDYIHMQCRSPQSLTFDGTTLTQIVPADPHSGDYAFWSNRGDHSDMTLTHSFDFRDVQGQILFDYWVWYDIEEDWDYLYLVASLDGGEEWEILRTPSSTDTDPSGNSYGWGYTGASGSGYDPVWIQETVDLSRFAGQEVILRFEYITDAAVNGEGLLLDDLSIDAIGYSEDFEQGNGGWEPAGFVRLYNSLPQTYIVALIEHGNTVVVREIELDDARHAEIPIAFGDGFNEATLIVIGSTRYTWIPAPYQFSLSR
jgi:immune inhibitor A